MGSAERRSKLIDTLRIRKHDTIHNLALEFGVSERTLRRDIETLSLSFPIYTQTGRYGGGVYLLSEKKEYKIRPTECELKILQKILVIVERECMNSITVLELEVFKQIITNYETVINQKG